MTDTATQTIPIETLSIGDNVRRDLGDVEGLARSIATVGLLNPVTVRMVPISDEEGEGDLGVRFELVAGHRRVAALRRLGEIEVPYVLIQAEGEGVSPSDRGHRLAVQLIENLQREDLGPMEEARALGELVELVGSQKAAAAAIGKSTAHVSKRLTLLRLAEPAVELLGRMPIEDVVDLARLDPKTQAKIARKVEGEVNPRTVRSHIDSETRQVTRDAASRKAAKTAAAEKANRGLEVVAAPDRKSAWKSLEGWNGLVVDQDAHAKEPCHRVVVGFLNSWDTEPGTEVFCAEPARHTLDGDSPLKVEIGNGSKAGADRQAALAKAHADREWEAARWWGTATQAVEDLDRNTALKVLSAYVLGSIHEDDGDRLLEAIGVTLPQPPESDRFDGNPESRGAWKAHDAEVAEIIDGLSIAQTYRAAVLWVLDNTAASPTEWQRERHPAPYIAVLVGIDPETPGDSE